MQSVWGLRKPFGLLCFDCAANVVRNESRCRPRLGLLYWAFVFIFAHLARAARRIFSLRCSAVILFAVALPSHADEATHETVVIQSTG
jgi:hypothetical protein